MDWLTTILQFLGFLASATLGIALVGQVALMTYTIVSGRRSKSGRKRLSLVIETRIVTRMLHGREEEFKKRHLVVDGKRVNASISRPPLSPISTPMAREIASWHGFVHLHRSLDTKIGNYPLVFTMPRSGDRG